MFAEVTHINCFFCLQTTVKFLPGISLKANKTNARSFNYFNFKMSYHYSAENSLESEPEVNWLKFYEFDNKIPQSYCIRKFWENFEADETTIPSGSLDNNFL